MATDKATTQIERFRQAARELETDDDEERFAATVKKLGSAPPQHALPKPKKPGGERLE